MRFTTLAPPTEAMDPSRLGFEIQTGRSVLSHDPCDDLTSWHAQLYVPGWLSSELWPEQFPTDGARDDRAPPAAGPRRVEDHILATARVCTLNLYRETHLVEILDCESADLAEFIGLINGNGLTEELEDSIEGFGTQLVILDRVTVSPLWRGLRLGPLIAALALDTVGADAGLFASSPGAFELEHGTSERASADQRLVELWTKFGFTIPHRHLLLAEPALTDWSGVVRELCEEEECW